MKKTILAFLISSMLFFFTSCVYQETPQTNISILTEHPSYDVETNEPETKPPDNSKFEVHYIDVGQADAAIVRCDDKTMIIDGGNVADSNLIVAYLKKLNIGYIDYMICSHAHEDHVGCLSGALSVVSVGTVYAPQTESDSKAYQNFKSKIQIQGLQIHHPQHGETFLLGSSTVKIIAPIAKTENNLNNTSIVLKITYGTTSFLFTGDAEREEEQDILNAGYDLSSTVLKVGHHGAESSTSYVFSREVMPKYAIISVGKENVYGHPAEETLSRFRDSNTKVYRTDLQGDIIVTSNGENVTVKPSRNADVDTIASVSENSETQTGNNEFYHEKSSDRYIGNYNTKKFHLSTCRSLPAEKNRVYFSTRDEATKEQFLPCGICSP